MDNDHFCVAMQLKLDVWAPDAAVCQIPQAGDASELCMSQLSNPLAHPHVCKCGPAFLRPHRSQQVRFQALLKKARCFADLEHAVPFLYRIDAQGGVTEAILDLVMFLPGVFVSSFFDFTMRCTHSVRQGARVAGLKPSVAAAGSELERLTSYGSEVILVCFGTCGRLGRKSQLCLRSMAQLVASLSGHVGGT
jgi:hypothetical protein